MNYEVKRGNHNKCIFSDEQINEIIDLNLNQNISSIEISKLFNVAPITIRRLLDDVGAKAIEHNINSKRKKKYHLDSHYFDIVDTQNKAYILGLLFADGTNVKNRSMVKISLQEEDRDILENIRNELNSDKPLEYLDYSNKHDYGYNYKNQYSLILYDNYLCSSLENLGMVPNKSLSLNFPDIPFELYPHFIRGYFDGDGSIWVNQNIPRISFTSTEDFCVKLQNIFMKNLNISGGGIYDASCHNGITKVLSIGGSVQVRQIMEWLYKDANMFMERKYSKYYDWFSEYYSVDIA